MALTYEDINGPSAGDFDKTANALLKGVADYLELDYSTNIAENHFLPVNLNLEQNYPNPFNSSTNYHFQFFVP